MSQPIERVHYYNGEYLNAGDFQAEQDYNMDKSAWLNRSMFTYGVASGLHVCDLQAQRLISVSCGMAIDGLGREIILTNTAMLSHNCQPGLYYLTITYGQQYGDPVQELNAGQGMRLNYKRIVEQPVLELKTDQGKPSLNILLAIITITNNGKIAAIEYDNGQSMRRQCGVNAGTVHFYLEGVERSPAITSFQNQSTDTYGLLVRSPRTLFTGPITSRQSLSIGVETADCALTVQALLLQGLGRIV